MGSLPGGPIRKCWPRRSLTEGSTLVIWRCLDKEQRGGEHAGFTIEDRRFLESVSALAGVALDSARQVEDLETQRERLQEENKALRDHLSDQVAGQRIVASAAPMRQVLERVERVAPRSVSVVIRGESGTGKELIAKLLHSAVGSRRCPGGGQLRRYSGDSAGE